MSVLTIPSRARTCLSAAVLLFAFGYSSSAFAVPSYLNGTYDLECEGGTFRIDLVLASILGNATDSNAGSSTFVVYCGPDWTDDEIDCGAPDLDPQYGDWCNYQHQLDSSRSAVEGVCLANPFNTHPDRDAYCASIGDEWRDSLAALNDGMAGIAATRVTLSVWGNFWNDFFRIWGSFSTTTLASGAAVATNYTVRPGPYLWSGNMDAAASSVGSNAGCAGGLIGVSEGHISGTTMRVNNSIGGLLSCAVGHGDNAIGLAVGLSLQLTSVGDKQ